jgi:hypothetical protein
MYFQYYIVNSELKSVSENKTRPRECKIKIINLLNNITEFMESVYDIIECGWVQNNPCIHSIYNGDVTTTLPEINTDVFQVIRFSVEYGYHWGCGFFNDLYPPYACHNDNKEYYQIAEDEDEPIIKIYDDCFKYDWVEYTKMYTMTAYTDWFSDDAPTIFRKNHSRIQCQEFLTKHPNRPSNSW